MTDSKLQRQEIKVQQRPQAGSSFLRPIQYDLGDSIGVQQQYARWLLELLYPKPTLIHNVLNMSAVLGVSGVMLHGYLFLLMTPLAAVSSILLVFILLFTAHSFWVAWAEVPGIHVYFLMFLLAVLTPVLLLVL